MQLISISKDIESGAGDFAESIANKMGYDCISRDDLFAEANRAGIHVAKLELAMVNRGVFNEKLAVERDHYIAFSTAYLCKRIIEPGLVYHGRTGHYLFPSLSNVLKLRVFSDDQMRINNAMNKLNINRNKAKSYIEEVEKVKRNWIKSMYGISWEEKSNYALGINLAHVNTELAVTLVENMASQPEFMMTNTSLLELQNLILTSKIKITLANDNRTNKTTFNVHAENGIITITYLPQDEKYAKYIAEVCRNIDDIIDIRLTMATTNILWIQEEFSTENKDFKDVIDIAAKWNAAVELLRYLPDYQENGITNDINISNQKTDNLPQQNGGIEDDLPVVSGSEKLFLDTRDKIAGFGLSGGGYTVKGDESDLFNSLHKNIPYVLIVIGDIFTSKGLAAKQRSLRELKNYLSDRLHAPVITVNELEDEYMFTNRDYARTILMIILAIIIYYFVFSNQDYVLSFLSQSGWYKEMIENSIFEDYKWLPKIFVSLVVILFVPIVATTYGRVTNSILKFIKME